MNSIAFIDIEVSVKRHQIIDIGGIKDNGNTFHSNSTSEFISFINGTGFICGHNILNHDLIYLQKALPGAGLNKLNAIDTLFLSPLLFPTRPYHHLLKDDKLQSEDLNNPLNDSIKARDLFNACRYLSPKTGWIPMHPSCAGKRKSKDVSERKPPCGRRC